jgi:hypothetical protein
MQTKYLVFALSFALILFLLNEFTLNKISDTISKRTDSQKSIYSEKNQNYDFVKTYKAISLYKNLLKKTSKQTSQYLFATFRQPSSESKVIVTLVNFGGYGNRVYCVIDSLIVSLLTDGISLINFGTTYAAENFIDLPVVMDSHVYEPYVLDLDWTLTQGWQMQKNATRLMQSRIPHDQNIIRTSCEFPHFFEFCSNSVYFEKLLSMNAVKQSTIANALALEGKTNEQKLDRLFQVGFEAAGYVLQRAWRLKPNMLALVNEYKKKFFTDSFVIGLQLRSAYIDQYVYKNEIKKFTDCALQIESKTNTQKPVKWFVVSDIGFVYHKLTIRMPNKTFFTTNVDQLTNTYDKQTTKTILDIELLSFCDEIVQTSGSTFGFVSAIKAQRLPYYVNGTRGCYSNDCKEMNGCVKMTLARPHARLDIGAAVY